MNIDDSANRLVLHDRPYIGYLISAVLFGVGIFVLLTNSRPVIGLVISGMGILMLLMSGAPLTIVADRNTGMLTLTYNYLVTKQVREYALSQITEVAVHSTRTRSSKGGSSRSYWVTLVTESGDEVRLRSSSSGGYGAKQKQADQLSQFLGLGQAGGVQPALRTVQQALHGSFGGGQTGQTNGVNWQLDSGRVANVAALRWTSPDFCYPGQFLLLAQKPAGSGNLLGNPSGMLGGVAKLLYRQLTSMYGLEAAETPGLESAELLEGQDPQLERHFMALASDPISARRLLNPWIVRPLADWAERHPLHQGQSMGPGETLQLVALFSPQGVKLTFMNASTPEQTQEISDLGAEVTAAARSYA